MLVTLHHGFWGLGGESRNQGGLPLLTPFCLQLWVGEDGLNFPLVLGLGGGVGGKAGDIASRDGWGGKVNRNQTGGWGAAVGRSKVGLPKAFQVRPDLWNHVPDAQELFRAQNDEARKRTIPGPILLDYISLLGLAGTWGNLPGSADDGHDLASGCLEIGQRVVNWSGHDESSVNQSTNSPHNLSPHPAIRFLDPPVTDYNSMDVDDSSMGRESLDDDIEYDTMSAGPPDALAAYPADDAGCLIDPDLYLRPEDDVINVDELPDAADPPTFDPATSEVSFSYQPELDFEEVHLMAQELHPFGKYQHPECLPDPSLQQLLEAERPFQTAWAETS
ncbi:hypothetical protein BDR03DRAFT_980507 [Suillus americanus]|nr:hypothetical protein BDR03DRAFT_980507 [Suillus americanus]